jgi:hypothetical protein
MVEWGGHHGGWGGFGPPSYIVKKCPDYNNYIKLSIVFHPMIIFLGNKNIYFLPDILVILCIIDLFGNYVTTNTVQLKWSGF